MGQHKHNINAQLAKEGKLPPRSKKVRKPDSERLMFRAVYETLFPRFYNWPSFYGRKEG